MTPYEISSSSSSSSSPRTRLAFEEISTSKSFKNGNTKQTNPND